MVGKRKKFRRSLSDGVRDTYDTASETFTSEELKKYFDERGPEKFYFTTWFDENGTDKSLWD